MASVPFDQLDGFIWMNGEFVKWADAKIHVLTHGLHYASAVFEGERAYGGEIFKLTEHTERLHESARILGFKIPYSVAEIDDACRALLKKQGFADAYVRPIAWRGSEQMGVSAQNNRINCAIAIWQWPSYFDPAQKLKGIRLDIAEYRRPDPRTAPSQRQGGRPLHDLHAVQACGRSQGLCRRDDARLARPGRRSDRRQHLLRQGRRDPHAGPGLLPGRHHPPDRDRPCPRRGIEVVERAIMPEELEGFEQCFLTGTAAEVTPVAGDRAVPLRGRRDRQDADERLLGRSAAEARDRRRVSYRAWRDGQHLLSVILWCRARSI